MSASVKLFDAQKANADSSPIRWFGGSGTIAGYGTFDSDTLKLQASFDGGASWIDVTNENGDSVSVTSNGMKQFNLGPCLLRLSIASDSQGNTSITAWINEGRNR